LILDPEKRINIEFQEKDQFGIPRKGFILDPKKRVDIGSQEKG